jgi:hypothetical protein
MGQTMTDKSGPEIYAPRNQRTSEKQTDTNQAATNPIDSEFPHKILILPRQRSEVDSANGPITENLNALIQRVAGASMDEVDRVIRELESIREMLRNEGERVTQEVADYANTNDAAMTVMRVIADNIKQWTDTPDKAGRWRSVS